MKYSPFELQKKFNLPIKFIDIKNEHMNVSFEYCRFRAPKTIDELLSALDVCVQMEMEIVLNAS